MTQDERIARHREHVCPGPNRHTDADQLSHGPGGRGRRRQIDARLEGLRSNIARRHERANGPVKGSVPGKHADRVAYDCARQMLERDERPNLHVRDVGQPRKRLAASDILAAAMRTAGHDAGKRGAYHCAPDLVVDLSDSHARDVCIADCEIPVGLGLFEFELGHEARTVKFPLAPKLAFQLPHVDLGPLQQGFLFRALQQQRLLVDASNRVALFYDGSGFGYHEQLPGHAGRNLHFVTAVDGAGDRDRRSDLGSLYGRYLYDSCRHRLLCESGSRQKAQQAYRYRITHRQ